MSDEILENSELSPETPAPAPEETKAEPEANSPAPSESPRSFDERVWALMGSENAGPDTSLSTAGNGKKPTLAQRRRAWERERDYLPVRTRRDAPIGCLGGLMYAAFVICLSILLACVGWMCASDVLALNKPPLTAEVTLPEEFFSEKEVEKTDSEGNTVTKTVRSADIDAVCRVLKEAGFINYRWLFRLYASFSDAAEQLDPGTYSLSTSYDYRALVKKMQLGSDSMVQTRVTLPEGFTMEQIFTRLEENGICKKADLYAAAAETEFSYAFLEDAPVGDSRRLEGFLFPDTYFFYQGMQASSAISKFLTNFRGRVTAEMIATMQDRNLSYKSVVTLASVIEREAADDNERYLISSVIYNRLARDMALQIDATVLYGEGNPEGVVVATTSMTQNPDNPYNSYLYKGLPPTPICNPGLVSLRAALNPGDTQYLYYALDEATGKHCFFIYEDEFMAFLQTQSYYNP